MLRSFGGVLFGILLVISNVSVAKGRGFDRRDFRSGSQNSSREQNPRQYQQNPPQYQQNPNLGSQGNSSCPSQGQNDSDLIRAVNDQRYVRFVEAEGLEIQEVLPDDNQGLKHQKWVAKLSNGMDVYLVYNSDMGSRVPAKVGEKIAVAGEFKWISTVINGKNVWIGLVHWLHRDPKGTRPDGYINYQCKYYGK